MLDQKNQLDSIMKKLTSILVFVTLFLFTSCTTNTCTRQFGGTQTRNLPKGQKLVNLTWKESSLWILTRPMRADEQAETYSFQEESAFGMNEGTVIVVESK